MRITPIRNFATSPRIFKLETWNSDHWKVYEISKLLENVIFEFPKIAPSSGENIT